MDPPPVPRARTTAHGTCTSSPKDLPTAASGGAKASARASKVTQPGTVPPAPPVRTTVPVGINIKPLSVPNGTQVTQPVPKAKRVSAASRHETTPPTPPVPSNVNGSKSSGSKAAVAAPRADKPQLPTAPDSTRDQPDVARSNSPTGKKPCKGLPRPSSLPPLKCRIATGITKPIDADKIQGMIDEISDLSKQITHVEQIPVKKIDGYDNPKLKPYDLKPPIPDGWTRVENSRTQEVSYLNMRTKKTQTDRPTEPARRRLLHRNPLIDRFIRESLRCQTS